MFYNLAFWSNTYNKQKRIVNVLKQNPTVCFGFHFVQFSELVKEEFYSLTSQTER